MFESLSLNLLVILLTILFYLYFYSTRKFKYWKNLGVPYVPALPFVGSLKDIAFLRISVGYYLKNIYDQYKTERYLGMFSFDQPAIIIRDLEIAKNILVKDSQYFVDHFLTTDPDMDPLAAKTLFMIKGQKWKNMRNFLSPTFTSGKMKNMFFLVDKCAQELDKYLDSTTSNGSPVEVKYVSSKYTIDTIASCAFGIDSNSLKDPQAEFTVRLNKAFQFDSFRALKATFFIFKPELLKLLKLKMFDADLHDFVRRTVWTTIDYREKHSILRNDFLDNLRELRKKVEDTDSDFFSKLDDDDYAAQAFSFLLAGFETSSTTMSFTLYEMAVQPEVQTTLREEIREILQKYNNEVTYEAIQKMKYLDMVVNETLRKYPPVPFINRKCTKEYELPAPRGEGTITIPAGTGVYIPLLGVHYDPEYYPNPEKFDPERFTDENKQKRHNYSHMPFGEGPRMCIGMRFGLLQTKTGLIHILSRYEVKPCKDTAIPLVMDKKAFLMQSKGGIPLTFKRIMT